MRPPRRRFLCRTLAALRPRISPPSRPQIPSSPNPPSSSNTVGYWTKMEDWVNWEFEVVKAGKFEVEGLQGCGKGSGGAEVAFAVGEQVLTLIVEDTGGFQNFVPHKLGTFTLPAGKFTLTVRPKTKPGGAVMDLRQVTLRLLEK